MRETKEDWFRLETKDSKNSSIVWKSLVYAFPLVWNWTSWHIGDRRKVRLGEGP